MGYLGRRPAARTYDEAANALKMSLTGFDGVPSSRWMEEAMKHFVETEDGLDITYDPRLRDAVQSQGAQAVPDLWPFFDATSGLPLACIRGENSNLLTAETLAKMQTRRPDMITATAIGRGHIPFLDEPEAVAALKTWIEALP